MNMVMTPIPSNSWCLSEFFVLGFKTFTLCRLEGLYRRTLHVCVLSMCWHGHVKAMSSHHPCPKRTLSPSAQLDALSHTLRTLMTTTKARKLAAHEQRPASNSGFHLPSGTAPPTASANVAAYKQNTDGCCGKGNKSIKKVQ